MKKKIIISVTSDLITDQRVHRSALTLLEAGYDILLVGRKLKNSLPLDDRRYKTKRFKLLFNKGILFYANYNIRLFFFLMTNKCEILLANDLDTLMPNYLISKIRNQKIVYDSHEYFTGVPELDGRPMVRGVWKTIERFILPKLKFVFTVNESIATLYRDEYKIKVDVVRNVPMITKPLIPKSKSELRNELGLPADKFIVILQGNGINIHRGAEEAVEAMQFVDDALLLIAGSGDVIDELKKMVSRKNLEQKVSFKPRMPYDQLLNYTRCADLGLTLDKSNNINYKFSLPNKLFDYIQCGVPVLASDLPEVRKIVEQYDIGKIVPNLFQLEIAKCISEIQKNDYKQLLWKENLKIAASELSWEKEKEKFLAIVKSADFEK